jgi:hypothetical protein
MKEDKIELYVVTHKEFSKVLEDRIVIGVGSNKNISVANCYDNTGDNIADKNPNYCELTALYWIWKNVQADIVGVEHYRRFFSSKKHVISINQVDKIFKRYDMIMPKKVGVGHYKSVYSHYAYFHYEQDLVITREVINELFSDYLPAFDQLKVKKKFYTCNMFIGRKEIIDNYCKWLFTILFEIEKRLDINDRNAYQCRVFGFLAERLFNVYLWKNTDIKIKECKVEGINISDNIFIRLVNKLIYKKKNGK